MDLQDIHKNLDRNEVKGQINDFIDTNLVVYSSRLNFFSRDVMLAAQSSDKEHNPEITRSHYNNAVLDMAKKIALDNSVSDVSFLDRGTEVVDSIFALKAEIGEMDPSIAQDQFSKFTTQIDISTLAQLEEASRAIWTESEQDKRQALIAQIVDQFESINN
jgi:hypothetical protein